MNDSAGNISSDTEDVSNKRQLADDPVLGLCVKVRGLCQRMISLQVIFGFGEHYIDDAIKDTMAQVEMVERLRRKGHA